MAGYNINMVSLQEQFELACALARANGATRTAIVCTLTQFKTLNINLKEGEVFNERWNEVKFPNGAIVKWVSSEPISLTHFGGYQFTTLFIADCVRRDVVEYLQTRLRSVTFKGDFKTYYQHGHVMWEVWEQYGG